MANTQQPRHVMDRKLISLEQEHEIRYWTQALGVTREQLREAIGKVGHSATRVREYLQSSKRS